MQWGFCFLLRRHTIAIGWGCCSKVQRWFEVSNCSRWQSLLTTLWKVNLQFAFPGSLDVGWWLLPSDVVPELLSVLAFWTVGMRTCMKIAVRLCRCEWFRKNSACVCDDCSVRMHLMHWFDVFLVQLQDSFSCMSGENDFCCGGRKHRSLPQIDSVIWTCDQSRLISVFRVHVDNHVDMSWTHVLFRIATLRGQDGKIIQLLCMGDLLISLSLNQMTVWTEDNYDEPQVFSPSISVWFVEQYGKSVLGVVINCQFL